MFLKISNGAIFDLDKVLLVARKDIGQYMIFIEGMLPHSVNADGNDVEAIEKALGDKLIVAPRAPDLPKSKLEIAAD